MTISWSAVLRALAVILACVLGAFAVANLVDLIRPQTLLLGRNFTIVALIASAFIALSALVRSRGTLSWAQLLAELLAAELVIAALVWGFSGVVAIDQLFITWWLGLSAYCVLPWLLVSSIRISAAKSATR